MKQFSAPCKRNPFIDRIEAVECGGGDIGVYIWDSSMSPDPIRFGLVLSPASALALRDWLTESLG